MFMEHDQLVNNGHISDWEPIQNRSHRLRTHLDVPCPRCERDNTITPIDHDYFVCGVCDTVADFLLLKLNSKAIVIEVAHFDVRMYLEEQDAELEPETHIVYCKVGEDTAVLIRKKMRCLSCDKPIRKRILRYPKENEEEDPDIETVYCSSDCGVRTYLRAGYDSTGIFIAPYLEAYENPAPDDPLEIPVIDAPPVARPPAIEVSVSPTPTSQSSIEPVRLGNPDRHDGGFQNGPNDVHDDDDSVSEKTTTQRRSNKKIDIEGQILAVLPRDGTRMHNNELLAKIGGTDNNKYAAIKRLKNRGVIVNEPRGWYARRI